MIQRILQVSLEVDIMVNKCANCGIDISGDGDYCSYECQVQGEVFSDDNK